MMKVMFDMAKVETQCIPAADSITSALLDAESSCGQASSSLPNDFPNKGAISSIKGEITTLYNISRGIKGNIIEKADQMNKFDSSSATAFSSSLKPYLFSTQNSNENTVSLARRNPEKEVEVKEEKRKEQTEKDVQKIQDLYSDIISYSSTTGLDINAVIAKAQNGETLTKQEKELFDKYCSFNELSGAVVNQALIDNYYINGNPTNIESYSGYKEYIADQENYGSTLFSFYSGDASLDEIIPTLSTITYRQNNYIDSLMDFDEYDDTWLPAYRNYSEYEAAAATVESLGAKLDKKIQSGGEITNEELREYLRGQHALEVRGEKYLELKNFTF